MTSCCGCASGFASATRSSFLRSDESTLNGEFDPDAVALGLEESLGGDAPPPNLGGFHVFTFNALAETEHWRQRHLAAALPVRQKGA